MGGGGGGGREGGGGGGGGALHNIFGSQVRHAINNWTQPDLNVCKNKGSKRSKINEKGQGEN